MIKLIQCWYFYFFHGSKFSSKKSKKNIPPYIFYPYIFSIRNISGQKFDITLFINSKLTNHAEEKLVSHGLCKPHIVKASLQKPDICFHSDYRTASKELRWGSLYLILLTCSYSYTCSCSISRMLFLWKRIYTLFFISNTFVSNTRLATPGWNWPKIKQMLSNTLRLNFCYLKIQVIHSHYHPKKLGHILKNKQKNKCVCIHEIVRLIIMKMKVKMKSRSHRYDMNKPILDMDTNIVNVKCIDVMTMTMLL